MRFYSPDKFPAGLIFSPVRPHDMLKEVPQGGYVREQGDGTLSIIDHENTARVHIAPETSEECVERWLDADQKYRLGKRGPDREFSYIPAPFNGPYLDGWQTGATWSLGSSTSTTLPVCVHMESTWLVMDNPLVNYSGFVQSVWPGLQPGAFGGFPLMQPVLHWGVWQPGDPSTGWFLRNWYLPTNVAFPIISGRVLTSRFNAVTGIMQRTVYSTTTRKETWYCGFKGKNNALILQGLTPLKMRGCSVVNEWFTPDFGPEPQANGVWRGTANFSALIKTVLPAKPLIVTTPTVADWRTWRWVPYGGTVVTNPTRNPVGRVTVTPI